MSVKERIKDFIKSKNIAISDFERNIGVANGYVNSISKGIGKEKLETILEFYPNLDLEWLITGNGEMLKSVPASAEEISQHDEHATAIEASEHSKSLDKSIPLIPLDAMAGFGFGEMRIMEYECDRYVVPMFRDANYLIAVKGSSMQPKYNSGDLVACRVVPLGTFFQWNKVYVLDTEQGALIKRVKRGSDDNHITLVSENEKYEPFELHLSKVNALAIVVGVLWLE